MSLRARLPDLAANANSAAVLNRRYLLGLGLVAVLVLLDQCIVQPPLLRLQSDPRLINLAGRQRMLSQKLAKTALALEAASSVAESERWRTELQDVRNLFSESHDRLHTYERIEARQREASLKILNAFHTLEPVVRRIREAGEQLHSSARPDPASVKKLLEAEGEFLPQMEQIVELYEQEARAHINRLIAIGWALTAFVLLALGGIGVFILRPTARIIDHQVIELRTARDELELRVEERTRELALEVERRALAEERQRALLQQFSQVARANTIGEMATGLAHELNQPLGAIANYAEGCLLALQAPQPALDEVRAALAKLLATTLRAGAIVKRIRQFVTRTEIAHERFEPRRLVANVEEFFREETSRRGIALRLELAPELPWLWGDPVQIQQVLVNLVRNAIDAIDAAEAQPVTPAIVIRVVPAPTGGVEFTVTDNGEGIPPDRLAQIFDAYFSTRDEGMGMGLAISRTILEGHDARFVVTSTPGVHTTFRFTLSTANAQDARTDGLHR